MFDLPERLSRQIVEALRITLTPPEDREIADRPIADIRAYEYFQLARQEYYRYTTVDGGGSGAGGARTRGGGTQ